MESRRKMTFLSKYGDKKSFYQKFDIKCQRQEELTNSSERCFFGNAPTLKDINLVYGNGTSQFWLNAQLANVSEFSGTKDKITKSQIEQLSELITEEYFFLKISEIMLFFRRFKLGKYGKFYGTVDPMVITTSLNIFLRERGESYFDKENKVREDKQREEQKKNHITYEEYVRRKKEKEKNDGIKEHEKTTLEKLADGEVKLLKEK